MPPLKLEVFETPAQHGGAQTVLMESAALEEARLQSFESGYAAGWEDATAAAHSEQARIGSELANNLQHMAFTFQEARMHILRSVQPVLTQLCTQLLPPLARDVLAPVVLDTLMPLLDDLSEQPVHVVVNPTARPAVEGLLSQTAGLALDIVEEPSLGEGQVYLRLGDVEQRVDLDHAVACLTTAIHDFFEYAEKDGRHG
ncbi:flagellar biosynthesis protein [Pseudorhodobacter sp. MZDSW-24AT]|uniref:FliH/SctL family protein n=1 Tax=Pseudorhodobacter sp. MZDSW-24AT TaxID=2052957 RepID=UPI000C1EC326|nr:flagellar biosynthesis protein [Pseudorhodobacter sp. MZDSW-24AT]PJF09745.1 flagellar biosynthesis protein [Pseudorhodobacter sp. MZDSW-24AT]